MGGQVNKLISTLIVLAFISTSTNLNYISSYISSDKDALRSMSANKIVTSDLQQSLLAVPPKQELLDVPKANNYLPAKTSSAGELSEILVRLKSMLKNPDLKPPVRRLIDSLIVWAHENTGLQNKNHIFQKEKLANRIDEIENLLAEIEQDIQVPGTGHLPEIVVISDYHGEINLFLKYVADAVSQHTGKKVDLDYKMFPQRSLREQLNDQGIDISQINMTFFLLGDFLDRGAYGIKCFRLAEEMLNLGIAEYVTGNHDLWAFLNVMGFHLPIYKDYNFYGHTKSEQLVTDHWNDSEIADNRFAWWTDKLAEYNASQQELQKDLLLTYRGEKKTANAIREDLKGTYLTIEHMLTEPEKKLWQDLVGYYFGTTDVYTGFRAVGMMSAQWWKTKAQALDRMIEASLENLSPESIATEIWYQLKEYTNQAAFVTKTRLDGSLSQGEWWWQVFNDINHQNYTSVEWWGKDWSSHKGWGTSVIDELNLLEDNGTWNQANYVENQHLKDLAMFYRKNFTLYRKDAYGNAFTHGWLPVDMDTGRISFSYNGITYEDRDIWNGLEAIQNDVRDLDKPLPELHEALSLVNSWYADKTTRIKPKHIKAYIEKVGLEKIYSKLGIKCWFTCHNPLNKLASKGISFKTQQDLLLHFSVDKGMSYKKFKDLGAYTTISSEGVALRGFSSSSFQRIIDSPPTVTLQKDEEFGFVAKKQFPNEPLDRANFLVVMREQLREELSRLKGVSPEAAIDTIDSIVERFEKRFQDGDIPSGVHKTLVQLSDLREIVKPLIKSGSVKASSAGDISKVKAAIQITPETEVGDLAFTWRVAKEAPTVLINHSEYKDYLGGTTERSNEQLKAFLKAGYNVIVAFGDFSMEYKGKDYLAAGIRKFPDTIESMKAMLSDAQAGVLDYSIQFEEMYNEAIAIAYMPRDNFILKYGHIPLTVKISEEINMGLWVALDQGLILLGQAKEKVIREISTEEEILYEINVLFDGVDKKYLHQMLLPYEPVQAIREAAIPIELAEYRRGYIQEAIADKLGVRDDEVDVIYGGGGSISNILELAEAGYAGAFIGRASALGFAEKGQNSTSNIAKKAMELSTPFTLLFNSKSMWTTPADHLDAYKLLGVDSKKVNITHVVSMSDYIPWQKALNGEDVSPLFADRSKVFASSVLLAVTAQTGIGEYPEGAYCGNMPAEFLKKSGVSVVLMPTDLNESNRSRIIEELRKVSIDYADIDEETYKGSVSIHRNKPMAPDRQYQAQVINISSKDDIARAIKDAKLGLRTTVWNVPIQELRLVSQQLYPKSSLAGTLFETRIDELNNTIDSLLSTAQDKLTLDTVQDIKSDIESKVKALEDLDHRKIPTNDIMVRFKMVKKANHILKTISLPSELAAFMAQDTTIQGISSKAIKGKIGGIVIDDAAMDIGADHQKVLLSLYGKASPVRAELEEKLKVKIILRSQYTEADKMPNMIAISNREFTGSPSLKGIMRIEISMENYSDSMMPIGPNLVLAQQLLFYNIDKTDEAILRVSAVYQMIARQPLAVDTMSTFIKTGVFKLELPLTVPVDKNYYAELERISAYTLVAA
ncbi:MAG: triose-phosphate isomerase [Candidatus Orphnella occulta]|nr:triose-phosphate isomerase [Candidatus Orphnella occulta]